MGGFFRVSLEIFILEGPLHDRYTRQLHRRGTVTPAIFGALSLERLIDRPPQIYPPHGSFTRDQISWSIFLDSTIFL